MPWGRAAKVQSPWGHLLLDHPAPIAAEEKRCGPRTHLEALDFAPGSAKQQALNRPRIARAQEGTIARAI